jgi:hypothetical protein
MSSVCLQETVIFKSTAHKCGKDGFVPLYRHIQNIIVSQPDNYPVFASIDKNPDVPAEKHKWNYPVF